MVGDRAILVSTKLNTIRIDEDAIWYGADLTVAAQ